MVIVYDSEYIYEVTLPNGDKRIYYKKDGYKYSDEKPYILIYDKNDNIVFICPWDKVIWVKQ